MKAAVFVAPFVMLAFASVAQAELPCQSQKQNNCSRPSSNVSHDKKIQALESRVKQAREELKAAYRAGNNDAIQSKESNLQKVQYELSEVKAAF